MDQVGVRGCGRLTQPLLSAVQEKVTVMSSIPQRDLMSMLVGSQRLDDQRLKKLGQLKDLLEHCLVLDPAKRMTINQALVHPFITDKMD